MTDTDPPSPKTELANKYNQQDLPKALLRLQGGHTLQEVRTFFPETTGVLADAWRDLQEEYDVERHATPNQDVHARSITYANPIDTTLALALKRMHGPKLEDTDHRPGRYRAPTVLSLTWHEPAEDGGTATSGFLMIHEICGGAGYLIEGVAGKEYWTIGLKLFEKELQQIFKRGHHWKIDYTTGEKIRSMLRSLGVYEANLAPQFDEESDVREYPDDYEPAHHAQDKWPERVFDSYE